MEYWGVDRMSERQTLDIGQWIDDQPIKSRQWMIIALCASVALLDGLDVQAIGLAAPGIGAELHIPPQNFGSVFSAALAGLALGAFFLGPLADRIGRKRVLIGSTLFFGLFTIATALAASFQTLLVYRFCAGLGLGGAMPSFISLATEFVPRARRAGIVSLVWAGFPLGGVIGGLLGSQIIPLYGWQSIFWVGGLAPIALALILAGFLPESLAWLITRGTDSTTIATSVRKLFPDRAVSDDASFSFSAQTERRGHVVELFQEQRTLGTICLWVSFYFAFMILVSNSSWTPLLLKPQGITVQQSSLALALYNFASVFGSGAAGYLTIKFKPQIVLVLTIIGGALAYASIGWTAPDVTGIFVGEALFGLLMGCGSSGLIGLGAIFYPSRIRSTGVGWATAAGRFGSFSGPLFIGFLVASGVKAPMIFALLAAGAGIGGLVCLALRLPKGEAKQATA